MDFERFLKHLIAIKDRKRQEILMNAHVAAMVNASEEGWNEFRASLGLAPQALLELTSIDDDHETDLSAIDALRDQMNV